MRVAVAPEAFPDISDIQEQRRRQIMIGGWFQLAQWAKEKERKRKDYAEKRGAFQETKASGWSVKSASYQTYRGGKTRIAGQNCRIARGRELIMNILLARVNLVCVSLTIISLVLTGQSSAEIDP